MRSTDIREIAEVYKQMKNFFSHIPGWASDSNAEFSFEKLLKAGYFKQEGYENVGELDWPTLTIFALYTCKQGIESSIHRKAKHIAGQSSNN